ncbi:hypothetical protein QNH14_22635 [Apirhabdus apintestini]|nr:hypothetical protein [Erwinia sp. HR93]MEA1063116.1 hypothetical protein [Erwinia sp. HR93]WPM84964.1 hypothetical protein QNH14_22635 [Enterobacteriaceae bacterium CA-0114]
MALSAYDTGMPSAIHVVILTKVSHFPAGERHFDEKRDYASQ